MTMSNMCVHVSINIYIYMFVQRFVFSFEEHGANIFLNMILYAENYTKSHKNTKIKNL